MLKILFIGDISGKPGREAVKTVLPKLKKVHKPDLVIANAENAAGGTGVTREVLDELLSNGVDVCTGGDHTFSIPEFYEELSSNLAFVRPANYEAQNLPGKGYEIVDLGEKGRVAVISLLGQELFTHNQRVRSPFWFADELLKIPEILEADARIIDFHAEATAESLSLAWYVKERVEALVGTHTHVATADNRLLGGQIAYVTDVGQVGSYEASLWVEFESVIHNFKYPMRKPFRLKEGGPRIFNSVLIGFETKTNEKKYSPLSIERVDVVLE